MPLLSAQENIAMRATAERLRDHLTEMAGERGKRMEPVADGQELGWQRFELLGMLAAVNNERAALAEPPVDIRVIEQAERLACGHSDYALKYAWYCAEIVFGVSPLALEH